MVVRDELHQLIDALPEREVHTARRFLQFLRDEGDDPVVRAFLDAPEDDEPFTAEDEAAVAEAEAEIARGEGRPWKTVRLELGLAPRE